MTSVNTGVTINHSNELIMVDSVTDISIEMFVEMYGQSAGARMLGVKRQTIHSWLNREGEWRVKLDDHRKPEGYYRYKRV